MGRPLKISKYGVGVGILGNTTPFAATNANIDQAFNAFANLDVPVPPTIFSGNAVPWTGVVGGETGNNTSANFPVVLVQANISLPNNTYNGTANASIIRQKGSRKFMVANNTAVTANAFVPGASYQISNLGTGTNWLEVGAGVNAAAGTIFLCTNAGAGTGNAQLIGTCVLTDGANAIVSGEMAISFTANVAGNVVTEYASKLTNKWVYDFNGGEPGGDANTGNVWEWEQVQQNRRYDANFFNSDGTEIKSGTTGKPNTPTQQNIVPLGDVESQS